MVPQECIQHQEQLVAGESSQNIVDIPTVQDQVIIQEIPKFRLSRGSRDKPLDPIKVVPEERVQHR